MRQKSVAAPLAIVVSLITPAFFLAQAAQRTRTLIISGHPGEIAVIEKDGHAYVEIEALARIANGSLSFNGNQITLALTVMALPSPAPATIQPSTAGFTKDFIGGDRRNGSDQRMAKYIKECGPVWTPRDHGMGRQSSRPGSAKP